MKRIVGQKGNGKDLRYEVEWEGEEWEGQTTWEPEACLANCTVFMDWKAAQKATKKPAPKKRKQSK